MATQLPAHKERRELDQILKEVVHNPRAVEIVFVNSRRQACMGPGGPLGHPLVYYTIGEKGYAECMYCDRVFVYDEERAGETITQI
ncbi:MAG: zinc-finger domain-containing protein [Pseudomonadota bacterium]